MKRVTKVFRGYFSLYCPQKKKPSFNGLEQESGMKVPTGRAAMFTVFFVNLITSNGGGGEMDCARNWVGSPSDDAHRHLTKALEIGPELPPASPVG